MVWCKISHIEDSIYDNNNSKVVYFNYLGRECSAIVSQKVLDYLEIESIENYSEVFVLKTFLNGKLREGKSKSIFVIKKVK